MTQGSQPIANNINPDPDQRARKRVAIGLAAQRPTAQPAPQRPPDQSSASVGWWPVLLLIAVALATLLLIAAKLLQSPTYWQPVRTNVLELFTRRWSGIAIDSRPVRLQLGDDFSAPSRLLADDQQPNRWSLRTIPIEGFYRLHVWPNQIAWSTLGVRMPTPFRIESAITIAPETPTGYGGLIGRYHDPDHFYWFAVDGQQRFQVQLRNAATLSTLQTWTHSALLQGTGQPNRLGLEDDGVTLRLLINDRLVFEVADPALSPGATGIIGGAAADSIAEINVDWIQLYDLGQ